MKRRACTDVVVDGDGVRDAIRAPLPPSRAEAVQWLEAHPSAVQRADVASVLARAIELEVPTA